MASNKTTTSQKHAELKRLGKQSQYNIYEMLRLTQQILDDHEYVDQFGGEGPLLEMLEKDEFAHFGGNPALATMLRAYRANPDRELWEKYRYNIRAMIDLAEPEKEKRESTRTNWKAEAEKLREDLARLTAENAALREQVEDLLQANGELRGELKWLRKEAPVS
jgi:hypothetical protein